MFLTSFIDWLNIINGLRIPVGNLGLSRSSMPQIDADKQQDFHDYLEANGVTIDASQVPIRTLRLTQNEINKMKVWKIMKQIRNKKPMGRVWVSSDNYVVDGSHRFVAALNMDGKQRMKVYKVDLPAMEFVKLARQFNGVRYRTVSDARF
ncbi:phage associated protein [Klebsiella phage vB_KqM-Bilbo]|uniref:ParB/Sulfiredoxin domain-containing protein n=2 Tax=Taipeivirus TaxID=2731621 RepID=A0A5Q2F650_9CAUD|nr:phage associated protein [Klebsiella phage 0507-KN2-1]YP_009884794.1 hypothetical protein HYQ02_gp141 [Klebsiella phage UPM 2146]UPW36065.1 hypothetical protein K751_00059 [Klebsiella phage K751]URG13663.1 hypothetical protein T751_00100 [Klebsiella phage T751]URG17983.1 hypothetical protein T765_00144 [Klebsiella phage T765]WOZ56613.1 hypothetical protein GHCGIGKI_00820 [Klebsiella phage P01]CAD5240449.1 phage associated protein [Klebsiella phage vB_KqM-Westerburg]CAD5240594.1 phage asso